VLVGVNKRTVAHLSITIFQILSEREIAGKGGKVLERKKSASDRPSAQVTKTASSKIDLNACRIVHFKSSAGRLTAP